MSDKYEGLRDALGAGWLQSVHADTVSALLAERDALREALSELVACHGIKQRISVERVANVAETDDDFDSLDRLMTELAHRKPKAWKAARAALAQGEV